jgi:UDP:flavonoid glycosyltransferase YjiC (YdhE family)
MARFLICTFPAAGHVNPALPIARTLVERGHEVVWYTGRRYRVAIEATGVRFAPIVAATEPEDLSFDERFPQAKQLDGLKALKFGLKYVFLDEVPGQIADMQRILQEFPADVILGDTAFVGMALLHELGGPRWATFGISALTLNSRDTAPFGTGLPPALSALERLRNRLLNALSEQVLFRDVLAHMQQVRARLGLPHTGTSVLNSTLSPYLYLQSSTPAFEYPRSDLPPQVHFIGPLLPETPPDFAPPKWWPELRGGKPVVLVNQGTIATDPSDLIVPTLRALEDEDVLVVATTGGASRDRILSEWSSALEAAQFATEMRVMLHAGAMGGFGHVYHVPAQPRARLLEHSNPNALPANARVEPFIPFGALLPHVDVMITNGGYGGVQFALAHGVPLVVAGTSEEKPEIAARIAWSGAGINLKTRMPTPEQIRSAVRTLLLNPTHRHNAERIRADYARHNAPEEAALLLERLAATGRPVLRGEPLIDHRSLHMEMAIDS